MKTTTSISNVSLQSDVHNHSALHSCSIDKSYKYIILPLCYSLTFLLSFFLNSTVLLRSHQCRSGRQWNASLIYMVNLASMDLMYSFSLPFLVASYVMRDHWVFGDFMCRLVRFLFYFNLYCSIFFLTCISIHRYMGICHPIRTIALESKRAVRGICATVCVTVFILTSPIVRFAKTGDVYRNCWDDVVWTIFQTLHSLSQHYLNRRRKSIKTIITITILFMLCFLPFHMTCTLFLILKETKAVECQTMQMVSICYKITRPLASCNSCSIAGHNTHLLWPSQILGGQKEAKDQEQGNSHKAEEAHESDSDSSGIT
uniref:G-protein coupled receptors family 1 profile domain-containing protein n=1 Tax=Cyprinus carpio carpio TaxID=630221 RepID=A0A8C1HQ87_CYPCA